MSRKITKKSKRRVLLISCVTITLISLILVNVFSVWKQLLEKNEEKVFYTEELKRMGADITVNGKTHKYKE